MARARPEWSLLLLTTFDADDEIVAHQELELTKIEAQARALELPLYDGVDRFGENGEFHTEVRGLRPVR